MPEKVTRGKLSGNGESLLSPSFLRPTYKLLRVINRRGGYRRNYLPVESPALLDGSLSNDCKLFPLPNY